MTAPGVKIRTPDQRPRVFVSSTLRELAEERVAVKEAIQKRCLTPVMFEEGARPHAPRDLYRAYVEQSHVFLGIYWQSYGFVAPNETVSGLEDEYALSGKLPKLIYFKRSDKREDRLNGLIARIRRENDASWREFGDAAELNTLVQDDLAHMLGEHFLDASSLAQTALPEIDAPPRWLPPIERGALLGRDELVAQLAEAVVDDATGCLTLTGPGGTGKTRLAIHMAHRLSREFPDGVFYVPLAAARAGKDVVPAVVSALELPVPPTGVEPEKLLVGFLRSRRALLVLDNFEQVLDAAGDVARVLAACPMLKIVVTSREALRIDGEREVPVPPLPHQPSSSGPTVAMQLFEQRAKETRPTFAIDDGNRAAVAEICRRLDALPLAIELAAARIRMLTPQEMLPKLDRSLALLTSGRRDLPPRQQTLRGTLEWSHDLLRTEERVFFRRLGVFTGSFPEDGAAAVAGDAGLGAFDGLSSLADKNLLVRTEVGGQSRFHMLETVRELAREKVTAAGEERDARMRHAEWMMHAYAGAHSDLTHATRSYRVQDRLALEEGNARDALEFLRGPDGDREKMWTFFCDRAAAQFTELRFAELVDAYPLMLAGGESSDPLRATLAAALVGWWPPGPKSLAKLERAVTALEAAGERHFLPRITIMLGQVLATQAPKRARPVLERGLKLAIETEQHRMESWARNALSMYFIIVRDLDSAQDAVDELLAAGAKHHDLEGWAFGMTSKGRLQMMRGDLAGARETFAAAAASVRSKGGGYARVFALRHLCAALLALDDDVAARAILEELVYFSATRVGITGFELAWGALAMVMAKSGESERATRVLEVVPRRAEDLTPELAEQLDPSGELCKATREARAMLDDPQPLDPADVDLEVALRAAVGPRTSV